MTLEDLAAIDTTTLLRAMAERLAMIETDELETKCLLPRPVGDVSLYEKLQELLAAARACRYDEGDGDKYDLLLDAIAALTDVKLPVDQSDPGEGDTSKADPGDIVALGLRHAMLARRLAELQHLYRVRMDVTREALRKARSQGSAAPSSSGEAPSTT
jgi:hypothetical protein